MAKNLGFLWLPRPRQTWNSRADYKEHRVKKQIDYVQNISNTTIPEIQQIVKTYPAADMNSYHKPVVVKIQIRRFKHVNCTKPTKCIDITKVKNSLMKAIAGKSETNH